MHTKIPLMHKVKRIVHSFITQLKLKYIFQKHQKITPNVPLPPIKTPFQLPRQWV